MTPLKRWLKKRLESWVGSWYEGPEPPRRLAEIVVDFGNKHPHATRLDWAEFAAEHAGEAYRRGYQRGYEWTERDPDPPWNAARPEDIADQEDPDWRWSPGVGMLDPLGIVPDQELPESTLLEEHIRSMQREEPPW